MRIVQSVKPMKPEFLRISQSNPDLYGPFWIMTTIIVLVSVSGNLAHYFRYWQEAGFQFRLELVRYALIVIYGYGLVYSTFLGLLLRLFGSKLSPIVVNHPSNQDSLPLRLFPQYFPRNMYMLRHTKPGPPLAINPLRHPQQHRTNRCQPPSISREVITARHLHLLFSYGLRTIAISTDL